jgi:hypothetical protein
VRIARYSSKSLSASLAVGAILIAGCGGVASSESAPPSGAVQVVRSTPQSTVRAYIEGLTNLNGHAVCSVLDGNLQHVLVSYAVSSRVAASGVPCAEAMSKFAVAITNPRDRGKKIPLPKFHVQIEDGRAVVRYIGALSGAKHTFVLVKSGPGWLIDKINGNG